MANHSSVAGATVLEQNLELTQPCNAFVDIHELHELHEVTRVDRTLLTLIWYRISISPQYHDTQTDSPFSDVGYLVHIRCLYGVGSSRLHSPLINPNISGGFELEMNGQGPDATATAIVITAR